MNEGKNYNRPAVLVLGIGNILLHDEGIGVYVIRELQKSGIPYHVELLDGGTAGADLLDDICDRLKVIVIDAIDVDSTPSTSSPDNDIRGLAGQASSPQAEIEPGTILRLRPQDLVPSANPSVSLHDFGLAETLAMARHLNCEPKDVVIFGVKPKDISPGLGLTPEISSILPEIIDLVLAEIEASEASGNTPYFREKRVPISQISFFSLF